MKPTLLSFVFVLFCLVGPARSQEVRLQQPYMSGYADDVAYSIVQQVVSRLPAVEREIARDVTIWVHEGGFDAGPRTRRDPSGNRIVHLPFTFLRVMEEMTVAQLLVLGGYQPATYPEEWLAYWGLRLAPRNVYDGPYPVSALEYARIDEGERDRFRKDYEQSSAFIYAAALADIILHEIGHHTADALYDPTRVSSSEARRLEAQSDDWASHAFRNFATQTPEAGWIDRNNLMGRFMALTFIRELEAMGNLIGLAAPRTHPETGARLRSALLSSNCEGGDIAVKFLDICEDIRSTAERLLSETRSEEEYRIRSNNGDPFAAFKLAFMRGTAGDHSEACQLFAVAAERGTDRRAHRHVGQCYAEAFLGQELSRKERLGLAVQSLCTASRDGWRDARVEMWEIVRGGGLQMSCPP